MRRPGFPGDVWPDEIQELLLRAVVLPGDAASEAWAAVRPRIDIDALPGELHRLMPALSRALTSRGVEDPDLPRLKGVYQYSWYRNQLLFADGARLISRLEAAGVATLLLRGVALSVAYFRDSGVRPMNDIDVLVRASDLPAARKLAEANGWSRVPGSEPYERREAAVLLRNDDGRLICLHWQLSRNLGLPGSDSNMGALCERAVPATLQQVVTRVPSAADALLQACVDGARANSGSSLRWITDVIAVMDNAPDLDWDMVVAESRRHHTSQLVGHALRYLLEVLGTSIPPAVVNALLTAPTTGRERLAFRLSVTTTPGVPSAAETLGRFASLTADLPVTRAAASAPRFLQAVLGVERGWDTPSAAVRKAIQVAVSPAPPMASLSRAGSVDSGSAAPSPAAPASHAIRTWGAVGRFMILRVAGCAILRRLRWLVRTAFEVG